MDESHTPQRHWNPDQYARFSNERAQPFFDLLALLDPVPGGAVLDLGCGTGELTARLHERARSASTLGIDSSSEMLAKALPLAGGGLVFEQGDIEQFSARAAFDVVFANASLQWVPDHPRLLGRLAEALRPGGQLAVQVPANSDHPSHRIAVELAGQAPFAQAIAGHRSIETPVLAPERYAEELHRLGFCDQQVRLQVYGHELASTSEVVEWTRGTLLLRFQSLLTPEQFERFVQLYTDRLLSELGDRSPYFYAFKRILFWARLPAAPPAGGEG